MAYSLNWGRAVTARHSHFLNCGTLAGNRSFVNTDVTDCLGSGVGVRATGS